MDLYLFATIICQKGHTWAVKWGQLIEGDIHDSEALLRAFEEHRPIAVLHFAASIEVGDSMEQPTDYYYNNVAGSLNLIRCMIEADCRNIVFSSTAATFGVPQSPLIEESHPQSPINPYGASKRMVEQIIRDCNASNNMRHMFLRYFNACGADSDGEIGESHHPETHLIPIVMQAASGEREKLFIFGDDYDTPDGTCLRDYIHVEHLASAHLLALEALLGGASSNEYNLGTGHGYAVREIIQEAERVVGHPIPHEVHPRRAGDPPILVASAQKAKRELNWTPQKNLTEILESAWRWHRHQS